MLQLRLRPLKSLDEKLRMKMFPNVSQRPDDGATDLDAKVRRRRPPFTHSTRNEGLPRIWQCQFRRRLQRSRKLVGASRGSFPEYCFTNETKRSRVRIEEYRGEKFTLVRGAARCTSYSDEPGMEFGCF